VVCQFPKCEYDGLSRPSQRTTFPLLTPVQGFGSRPNPFMLDFTLFDGTLHEAQIMKLNPSIATCTLMLLTQTLLMQTVSADATNKQPDIRFNEQIRPILSEYCFTCHGPDSAVRKAELRLDSREGAMAGGAIVPGNAENSELVSQEAQAGAQTVTGSLD
jgi:hypothetical protein